MGGNGRGKRRPGTNPAAKSPDIDEFRENAWRRHHELVEVATDPKVWEYFKPENAGDERCAWLVCHAHSMLGWPRGQFDLAKRSARVSVWIDTAVACCEFRGIDGTTLFQLKKLLGPLVVEPEPEPSDESAELPPGVPGDWWLDYRKQLRAWSEQPAHNPFAQRFDTPADPDDFQVAKRGGRPSGLITPDLISVAESGTLVVRRLWLKLKAQRSAGCPLSVAADIPRFEQWIKSTPRQTQDEPYHGRGLSGAFPLLPNGYYAVKALADHFGLPASEHDALRKRLERARKADSGETIWRAVEDRKQRDAGFEYRWPDVRYIVEQFLKDKRP